MATPRRSLQPAKISPSTASPLPAPRRHVQEKQIPLPILSPTISQQQELTPLITNNSITNRTPIQIEAPAPIYNMIPSPKPRKITSSILEEPSSHIQQLADCIQQSMKQTRRIDIQPDVLQGDQLLFANWKLDLSGYLESQGVTNEAKYLEYLKRGISGNAGESKNYGNFFFRTEQLCMQQTRPPDFSLHNKRRLEPVICY
ncbi:hypothetical protein EB796_000819 [Bugula neritina]|uniref:Uncharacterized protein n=1 Tax=Bugula neritina TaxID=10212 RepID=A0A7J7KRX0_BUGNE|nr:hypothetical protein EB796_000819 [Bugula neritina]